MFGRSDGSRRSGGGYGTSGREFGNEKYVPLDGGGMGHDFWFVGGFQGLFGGRPLLGPLVLIRRPGANMSDLLQGLELCGPGRMEGSGMEFDMGSGMGIGRRGSRRGSMGAGMGGGVGGSMGRGMGAGGSIGRWPEGKRETK